MTLDRILIGCDIISIEGSASIAISDICNDSRKVTPGALFVAVKGFACDGHRFIEDAVRNGASAVICEDIDDSWNLASRT